MRALVAADKILICGLSTCTLTRKADDGSVKKSVKYGAGKED
jgi:hypothetical protein